MREKFKPFDKVTVNIAGEKREGKVTDSERYVNNVGQAVFVRLNGGDEYIHAFFVDAVKKVEPPYKDTVLGAIAEAHGCDGEDWENCDAALNLERSLRAYDDGGLYKVLSERLGAVLEK